MSFTFVIEQNDCLRALTAAFQGFSDFKKRKQPWRLYRDNEAAHAKGNEMNRKRSKTYPLVLENEARSTTYAGQPEGGISGAGSGTGYFVLVKEGPNFTALPIRDLYTFKAMNRTQAMSLEEAERQMERRGAGAHLRAGSRLGALAAKAEEEGGEIDDGDQDGDVADSDEEREGQRVARMRATASQNAAGESQAVDDEVDDMPSAKVDAGKGEKGEDWEHEEERADDDLEQGHEETSDDDAATAEKKGRPGAADADSDAEEKTLTQAGQELNRILKRTRLSSGSEDDDQPDSSDKSAYEDDDDDDDDDVDLDEMASGLMPKVQGEVLAQQEKKAVQEPASPPLNKVGAKRKAATPPAADNKKVKSGTEAGAKPDTKPGAGSGPPTSDELLKCLRAWGPITTSELTARFRSRLTNQQHRQTFTANVKKVSKLEERPPGSGKKFVVPKV